MRLLIVGTLEGHISAAAKIAMGRGAKVAQVDTIEAALAALRGGQGADLVMVDVNLNVKSMMESLRSERINAPVVACGIGNETDAAVEAIQAGVKEYVPLPPDPELIAAILEAATEEASALIHGPGPMEKVIALADQIAPSDASVLIVGESGTGKELIARQIHQKSKRANERFVSVNCAAIPENLLESELFGHEKGAFTGAVARRIGKFEEASAGTLLLDEISEMDPHLQATLLRAIQEREIDRVGGNQPVKVDIRVIATTNRDLAEEVRAGRFREDLLFRLNVFTLELPPLRERREDIALLAEHFAVKFAELNALPARPIEPAALEALRAHHWRGNVRELENTMHRAVLLAEGDTIGAPAIMISDALGAAADDDGAAPADASAMVGRTVADVERDLILNTLEHCLGNRTHAANILGISIRTLRNKLKLYTDQGIPVPAPGEGERVAS
ncbi:MAG: sigma-54 dependent transcriptional regulator [Alphaproteobacteria bacterium]